MECQKAVGTTLYSGLMTVNISPSLSEVQVTFHLSKPLILTLHIL